MNNLATAPQIDTTEHRRFHRVAVDLLGRFMLEDETEYPCRVQNMSAGDVAIVTAALPRRDERVILYADHIGRLEGTVSRTFLGGFAMTLRMTERKREKLAAQITWLANRHELDLPEDRRHERVHPKNPFIDIVLDDGRKYKVRIIDLSLSGAAVKAEVRPTLGSRIKLGTMQGRVVRHLEEGLAIEFAAVQLRETLEQL
jgi:hypothetical protein